MRCTETWYRLFLRAFPTAHRTEYGAEMLGTLLDRTPHRLPSPRETTGLVLAGFTARFRTADPSHWRADGLCLGLLALSLTHLSYSIADRASPWWLAVSAALVVTLLRGSALLALPLALLVAVATGRTMLFGLQAMEWAPFPVPAYHD